MWHTLTVNGTSYDGDGFGDGNDYGYDGNNYGYDGNGYGDGNGNGKNKRPTPECVVTYLAWVQLVIGGTR